MMPADDDLKHAIDAPDAAALRPIDELPQDIIDAALEAYQTGDHHLHWRSYDDRSEEDIRLLDTGEVVFTGDADECSDYMHRVRLTAALRVAWNRRSEQWRPIEMAPKDGTWIIARGNDGSVYRVSWGRNHRNEMAWCSVAGTFVDGYLTAYIACPPPPLAETSNAG